MPEARPPLILPRGLIMLAAIWLIVSWLLALGLHMPIQPSAAAFTPGVRLMLLSMAVGLMIGWPLLRLSQQPTAYPGRQTMLDLFALLALVQIVVWPMRLITAWPPVRTAAIDATIIGWALLAGAMIAASTGVPRRGPRTLAMLACLAMCFLGPVLAWVGVFTGGHWMDLMDLGPLMAINTLGRGGGAPPSAEQWRWITLLLAAAVIAWIALGVVGMFGKGVRSDVER
ncbi:MAG: hypothetical protein JSV91_02915 [Phycisphaerales bacterium]|nr:MAG: hypothetical protein JSV91_02915 [Phycisphaerales bacterium]